MRKVPESPMLAYFDTNVFGHLLERKQGITAEDEEHLRATIKSGSLSVLAGIHAIDETAAHPRDPVPQLCLIWELCDWDRIVKSADMLLGDDIKHFVYSGDAALPLMDARQRYELREAMQMLLADPERLTKLRDLVKNAGLQKNQFCFDIRDLKQETRSEFLAAKEREQVCSFDEYFKRESPLVAKWLAERVGLKQDCERRSWGEFLKIRSVRMAVGMGLSYIWANNVETWKVEPSDSGDLQHVIPAAAAADVFVTHDSGLAELARRVALRGLRVTTLKQLLEDVG
jgi:hypothetical protein